MKRTIIRGAALFVAYTFGHWIGYGNGEKVGKKSGFREGLELAREDALRLQRQARAAR